MGVNPDHVLIPVAALAALTIVATTIRGIVKMALRYGEMKLKQSSPPYNPETDARLERIEHAIDAMAIEVERISEGQRFTTKLLADRARAEPIEH
ncbi:MAG TPA: hypothetical protein VJ867_15085 [Gemmatimonadaceae bacterium]|nr:hypothetical protein [Gemmatimonadaceae bacterium]